MLVQICMHLFICAVMCQCNIVPAHGLLSTISKSLALPGQVAGYPNAIHESPSTILSALTDSIMDVASMQISALPTCIFPAVIGRLSHVYICHR
jgi:hypothetical protein